MRTALLIAALAAGLVGVVQQPTNPLTRAVADQRYVRQGSPPTLLNGWQFYQAGTQSVAQVGSPYLVGEAGTVLGLRVALGTAGTTGDTVVELRKNGSAVAGSPVTIASGATTGSASFTTAVVAGDVLTVYTTAVAGTPGTGITAVATMRSGVSALSILRGVPYWDTSTLSLVDTNTPFRFVAGTGGAPVNQVILGSVNNSITGAGANSNAILGGGGTATYNEIIGGIVSTIGGGYDHTIDMSGGGIGAGTIAGGGHNTIGGPASATDHGTISGGSYNVINPTAGSYITIAGGTGNTVGGASSGYSSIGGGTANSVANSTNARIGGGNTNAVLTGANYSSIGGGANNQTGGQYAVIAGGNGNQATGLGAAVLGGYQNQALTTSYSAIGGGYQNVANNAYSVIVGGRDNQTGGDYSVVSGYQAASTLAGSRVHAYGQFAARGDNQQIDLLLRKETADETPAYLAVGGAVSYPPVPTDTVWTVDIMVAARATGSHESAGYRIQGVLHRDSGNIAWIGGTPPTTVLGESVAGWDCVVDPVASSTMRIKITGEAAKTVRWFATIRIASVTA